MTRRRATAPLGVTDPNGPRIKHDQLPDATHLSSVQIKREYDSDSSDSSDGLNLVHRRNEAVRGVKLIPRSVSNQEARRLTRQCQIRPASIFHPQDPLMTPEVHFPLQTVTNRTRYPRFVNRFHSREMMLVVDGSCSNNGAGVGKNPPTKEGGEPSGGASFIFKDKPRYVLGEQATTMPFLAVGEGSSNGVPLGDVTMHMPDVTGKIALRLEQQGPRGDLQRHTSNRAKLRAVIAALDFCPWHGEGWERIVVVTDLNYVVLGATKWMPAWLKRRWRTSPQVRGGKYIIGKKLANRDLWEELQSRVEMLRANGTEVAFWHVPSKSLIGRDSELLREAKKAAREAATSAPGPAIEEYTKLCGVFV